nr:hypothetical protein Iba_chr09bCG9230 [Ipomoea batatas]
MSPSLLPTVTADITNALSLSPVNFFCERLQKLRKEDGRKLCTAGGGREGPSPFDDSGSCGFSGSGGGREDPSPCCSVGC